MLKLGIYPEKLYRATFIRQYGLCCCNMALVSFRLFCKNLGHLRELFGQMVYQPPWQKISRTPMPQLLCSQDLDQLSKVRRRENDQQRLVYWLRTDDMLD